MQALSDKGVIKKASRYQVQFRHRGRTRYIGAFGSKKDALTAHAVARAFLANADIQPAEVDAILPPKTIARLITLRERNE